MNKGLFYCSSKKGIKPTAMVETWRDHYMTLSASYSQQGLHREAEIFREAAEDFQRLEQELEAVLQQQASGRRAAAVE